LFGRQWRTVNPLAVEIGAVLKGGQILIHGSNSIHGKGSQQSLPQLLQTTRSCIVVLCSALTVAVELTGWNRTEKWYEETERKDEEEPNSSCFLSGTTKQ